MSRRKIKAGSTSQTVPLFIQDSSSTTGAGLGSLVSSTAGLAAKYRREGESSWTTISLITATVGTWTSRGFISDGGPVTGGYEFGVPDAVLAAGAKWAEIAIYGATNMLAVLLEFELDAIDYQNSAWATLLQSYSAFETGTAQSGGASTITLRSGASAVDNFYKDQAIFILSGTGAGQTGHISSYVGSTKVATMATAWATQPDVISVYLILGRIG